MQQPSGAMFVLLMYIFDVAERVILSLKQAFRLTNEREWRIVIEPLLS
jgi:hypothetical protein